MKITMVIGLKDTLKFIGISVIACCALFVCTLFLNYNADIVGIRDSITSEAGIALYQAHRSMGKVICAVTGGCLVVTSAIMLLFYVKNYIDTHGKELGILKAIGYSEFSVAKHFWVFGIPVFTGCTLGFAGAYLYLPTFYEVQNAEKLFPAFSPQFHPWLAALLIAAPTVCFILLSVLYAYLKLKTPVLDLLKERKEYKAKIRRRKANNLPFLQDLKRNTRRSRKTLVFFFAFSAFCFSAMTQMSMSMRELSSDTFAFMIITIGWILAFMTLLLSLSGVVKANAKTIAMMRVFGYGHKACSRAILGTYRPISYVGFAIGTVYQYALLKAVMTFVFSDVENLPAYHFSFHALGISLVTFIAAYELILYLYAQRVRRLSVKSVMLE